MIIRYLIFYAISAHLWATQVCVSVAN